MKKLLSIFALVIFSTNLAFAAESKPTEGQLLEMYEEFDDQIGEIRKQFRDGMLNPDHIKLLIEHKNPFTDGFAGIGVSSFPVSVDYGVSVEDLADAGKYDAKHPDVNSKNFKTKHSGKADLVIELIPLRQLGKALFSDGVLKELEKRGKRPVEARELLAFGAKYPDIQKERQIVALDPVSLKAGDFVPYLCFDEGRKIYLHGFDTRWNEDMWFATVAK